MTTTQTYAVFSALAAPAILIGGWTVAESRQPASYHPVRDTISELAALGTTDRGIMTAAFAGTGLAYLITALGLPAVTTTGRVLIAIGGLATVLVALFPLPENGDSAGHTVAATIALLTLAVWPFFGKGDIGLLRPAVGVSAGVLLFGLVALFGITLLTGELKGIAERAAAGAQASWLAAVVLSLRLDYHQPG